MEQSQATPGATGIVAEPLASSSLGRLVGYAALAICIMLPVTLPVPVLRDLVQERFAVSELLTSLFMSINMLGAFLVAPLAGALCDRLGHERWLLAGALVMDAICFAVLAAEIPFAPFMAVRLLEGCAHITALSILLMLASQALPADRRGRAMGIVGGSMMLGIALGAPLGGVLGRQSPLVPLQVAAGVALAAALVAVFVVRDETEADERPGFSEILGTLRLHPALLTPLAFAFADRFTVGFFTTTFSLYVSRIHGLSPAQIGVAITAFMIPFAALSFPFGRFAERQSLCWLLAGGSVLYGLGTMAVGFTSPPALLWLMGAIGVTAAVMFVPSMLMTTQLAPAETRGTAMGAFNAAGSLGFIVGPVVGGAISEAVAATRGWSVGYQAAFGVAGASELLCVLVALPFLLRLRRAGRIT